MLSGETHACFITYYAQFLKLSKGRADFCMYGSSELPSSFKKVSWPKHKSEEKYLIKLSNYMSSSHSQFKYIKKNTTLSGNNLIVNCQ